MQFDVVVVSPPRPLPLLASLHALGDGLRCAERSSRRHVRVEFNVPTFAPLIVARDSAGTRAKIRLTKREPDELVVKTLGEAPVDTRCHQLLDDASWKCQRNKQLRPPPAGSNATGGMPSDAASMSSRHLLLLPCAAMGPPDWHTMLKLSRSFGVWSRAPTRDALSRLSSRYSSLPHGKIVVLIDESGAKASSPGTIGAAPLSFYTAALHALRVPGHNASEPFIVVAPSKDHPIATSLAAEFPNAMQLLVQPHTSSSSSNPSATSATADTLLALHDARYIVSSTAAVKYVMATTPRRNGLQALWVWCGSRPASTDEGCDGYLPTSVSEYEVQVAGQYTRSSLAPRSSKPPHSHGRGVASTTWARMPDLAGQASERPRVLVEHGEWVYHDACIAYEPASLKLQLAQASPPASNGNGDGDGNGNGDGNGDSDGNGNNGILWPLVAPPVFIEYVGSTWKEPKPYPLKLGTPESIAAYPVVWHEERAGFVFSVSLDNLWHLLWHAVPMREFAMRAAASWAEGVEGEGEATQTGVDATGSARANGTITRAALINATSMVAIGRTATTTGRSPSAAFVSRRMDLLPHYSYMWPDSPKMVAMKRGRGNKAAAETPDANRGYLRTAGRVAGWPGWELAGLSLLPPELLARSINRTQAHLDVGVFHCYKRLYGGHGGFFPHFAQKKAWLAARPRIAAFRSAIISHLGLGHALSASSSSLSSSTGASLQQQRDSETGGGAPASAGSVLFVLRRRYRCIANEAEVIANVTADASLRGVVSFVRFDELTVRGQLDATLRASAIAGVHGQGLVWTSMLSASPSKGCALLELQPRAMAKVNSHSKYDYYRWTRLNECGYKALVFPDSPECVGQYFRSCGNLTVANVDELLTALRGVRDHVVRVGDMNAVSLH